MSNPEQQGEEQKSKMSTRSA